MLGRVVVVMPGCEVEVVISVSFVLAVLSGVIMDEVMIVVAGVVVGTAEEKITSQELCCWLSQVNHLKFYLCAKTITSNHYYYASFPSVASTENGLLWKSVKLKLFAESYDVQKVPWLAHASDYVCLCHVIFRLVLIACSISLVLPGVTSTAREAVLDSSLVVSTTFIWITMDNMLINVSNHTLTIIV